MRDLNQEGQRLLHTAVSRRDLLRGAGVAGAGVAAASLGGGIASAEIVSGAQVGARFQDGTPATGGILRLTGHQDIPGLSPEDAGATVPFVAIVQIHNGMVELDETLTFQPVLAAELPSVSDDGLTYTVKLREGITFQNGDAFSSADVKYTMDWIKDPANASISAGSFENVTSVEAPDPTTVVITLSAPNAAFNALIGSTLILPSAYHAEVGQAAYAQKPMGTGPFMVNSFDPAARVLLDAYPDHFRGRALVDQFQLDVVPEAAIRAEALENGESDHSVWTLTPEDANRLEQDPNFTTYTTLNFAVTHFPLNNQHPILSDVNVRKAMMYAIDRQLIIDEIYLGTAQIATSNLSPAVETYYTDQVTQYPYDPEQAAALLDESGWVLNGDVREKDGQPLTFTVAIPAGDSTRRSVAEFAQQLLSDVGIQAELREIPVAQILEQLPAGEVDAGLFGWTYGDGGDPDATEVLGTNGSTNFSRYSNPRVDELLQAGIAALTQEERIPIYHEIQQIVADEVPFLYIAYLESRSIFSNRVTNLPEAGTVNSVDELYKKAYTWGVSAPA
ncbi:MAG TPA: ABC transporter substrate-binding protein [Thermomicrobiales bacterium]|jgi:peptide/nickel transport system substrate-binding protein|nr:ABC transporter substrate-binding protein [Thermomicrobiales bacterium]